MPTPVTSDKKPDLSYIVDAGQEISKGLDRGKLVVLESTVYPGVVEEVLQPIIEQSGLIAGIDFGLAYCPERIILEILSAESLISCALWGALHLSGLQ